MDSGPQGSFEEFLTALRAVLGTVPRRAGLETTLRADVWRIIVWLDSDTRFWLEKTSQGYLVQLIKAGQLLLLPGTTFSLWEKALLHAADHFDWGASDA